MTRQDKGLVDEPVGSVLYDLVQGALAAQRVEASEHTGYYITNVLEAFARTEPHRLSRALGPGLLEAAQLEPASRYLKLKEVADTSLFLAGVFLDYVEAQLATTEYYFNIGASAYLHLSQLRPPHGPTDPFVDTYNELGRRFEDFVHVLGSIADAELFASNERVLGVYGRWLRAGTPRDLRRLVALGVIPSAGDDTIEH